MIDSDFADKAITEKYKIYSADFPGVDMMSRTNNKNDMFPLMMHCFDVNNFNSNVFIHNGGVPPSQAIAQKIQQIYLYCNSHNNDQEVFKKCILLYFTSFLNNRIGKSPTDEEYKSIVGVNAADSRILGHPVSIVGGGGVIRIKLGEIILYVPPPPRGAPPSNICFFVIYSGPSNTLQHSVIIHDIGNGNIGTMIVHENTLFSIPSSFILKQFSTIVDGSREAGDILDTYTIGDMD